MFVRVFKILQKLVDLRFNEVVFCHIYMNLPCVHRRRLSRALLFAICEGAFAVGVEENPFPDLFPKLATLGIKHGNGQRHKTDDELSLLEPYRGNLMRAASRECTSQALSRCRNSPSPSGVC